jgi:apolipoprotein N-acyltransferase
LAKTGPAGPARGSAAGAPADPGLVNPGELARGGAAPGGAVTSRPGSGGPGAVPPGPANGTLAAGDSGTSGPNLPPGQATAADPAASGPDVTPGQATTQPAARAAREPAGPADRGPLRLPLAILVALAGGLALSAAFPPAGIWPFAAAGPALLVVALWRRSLRGSFLVGLCFGLAFFVPLISWLINLAWYAWAALAIAEAVIFGLFCIGQRLMLRLPGWPIALACWWVAVEAFRDRWPYAFPWGRLAMSQAEAPTVRWVAVGGPPLLTFLLALAGATLAWLLLGPRRLALRPGGEPSPRRAVANNGAANTGAANIAAANTSAANMGAAIRGRAVPALAFAAAAGLALAGALLPSGLPGPGGPTAQVAAVQGNVPHSRTLQNLLRATTVTGNHAAATEQLAAQVRAGARPAPDVVIWPENSSDLDPGLYPQVYATIADAVAAVNRPILVGTVLQHPLRNTGQLWLPGRGPVAIYVKRQLVPFGEYIPFRGFISSFSSLPSLQPVNFTAGHQPVVFRIGKVRLGDVICYEVGFDNLVASEVTAGANLLTEQTNDADFEVDGQLGETVQQLAMARIRAIEFDRSMVVASTTGVSAIIAPDGSLIASTKTWQRAVLDERVPLLSTTTLAQRLGEWPEIVLSALAVAALAWAIGLAAADRRRSRHPAP